MMSMNYVLNNTALRSWWLAKRVVIRGFGSEHRIADSVSKEEFDLLLQCDGKTALPESETLRQLEERGMIRRASEGEETDQFLKLKIYENRYVPDMGINITERCNYNCRHCYEAVDNDIPRSEMPFDQCRKLLAEARDCGIQNIKITGGEPMMHRNFPDIVKCVYENEMTVDRINTNGFFINEALLDQLLALDQQILFNISYDGAGFHDWMRGKEGAEKDVLQKIRMLTERGFPVRAAMTLNRVNKDAAVETMFRMEELGVKELRIIRTSETPRWVLNAGNACLTFEEYYDAMVELFRIYAASDRKIDLNVWHFAKAVSSAKYYALVPVRIAEEKYSPDICLCGNARENITIRPDGSVFPCTPSPGLLQAHGMEFGNVFESGLQQVLRNSGYLSFVCKGVHYVAETDPKCAACRYFRQCLGGCRLFALGLSGNILAHDPSKCLFFEKQYDKKLAEALPGFRCLHPVTVR